MYTSCERSRNLYVGRPPDAYVAPEEAVANLEKTVETLRSQIELPEVASDYEQLLSVTAELDEAQKQLEVQMAEWESALLDMEKYGDDTSS